MAVRGLPAVRDDLLAAVDPFHRGCSAEVHFLSLKAARAGVKDDSVGASAVRIVVVLERGSSRESGMVALPLELTLLGLARAAGWMQQLHRVGGIEEVARLGVALAQRHIANFIVGGFGRRGVVCGDFALDVFVVTQQFRHSQRPGFIDCMRFGLSMVDQYEGGKGKSLTSVCHRSWG